MVRHNEMRSLRGARMRLRGRSPRRGAAMVEAGFTIVVLLLLTFGLVQYAMVYASALALNNLAREGARFASVRALRLGNSSTGREQLRVQVKNYVVARAQGTAVSLSDLPEANLIIKAPEIKTNAPVQVAIRYDMIRNKSFVPGLLPLPASFATYEASAVNLIE